MTGFTSQDHIKIFLEWQPLDERVKRMVESTHLYRYASYIKKIRLQTRHLVELCSSFDRNDYSFTVNGHKFYLGLQDVFHITGLPIVGEQLVVSEEGAKEEFEDRFRIPSWNKTNSIKVKDLLKFKNVDQDCSEDDLLRHAQAYLMFIIGCLVLPGWRRDELPCVFYRFVRNLDIVNEFAWGSGTLVHTLAALASRKNSGTGFFSGNTLLHVIFSIVHIPELGKYFELDNANKFPIEFPLMREWVGIMQVHSSNVHRKMEITDQMSVVYDPYRCADVPEERKRELDIIYVEHSIFCLNKGWTYRPQRFACHISDLDAKMPTDLTPMPSVATKKRNGRGGHDWAKENSPFSVSGVSA